MYRHHIDKLLRTRVDDILVEEGLIERDAMNVVHAEMDQTGKIVSDVLIGGGYDEWELAKIQVTHYGLPFIDVSLHALRREVLDLLPKEFCIRNGVLPLETFGSSMALACWEVPTPELYREIEEKSGHAPFLYLTVRRMILEAIELEGKRPQRGAPAPKPAAAAGAAGTPAAQAAQAAPKPAEVVAAAAAPAEPELPPLDIPAISMKLNASAQSVSATRRSVADRPAPRPSAPAAPSPANTIGSSFAGNVAGSLHGSMVGAAATVAGAPAAARAAPAEAPAPRPASNPASPAAAPRPVVRSAPVLPRPAAAKPAAQEGGWESIFDVGETAVKKSVAGEASARRPGDPSRSRP